MAQQILTYRFRITPWKPWIFYSVLALLVLLPLLKPGFVLTLDMVFTPRLRMPAGVSSSYVLHAVLRVLNMILPGDVLEKVLLFAIFLLAGMGMHRLVRFLNGPKATASGTAGAYFAGIFYTINPFTYDRLMAGQYNVLFGYALLPWFLRALLVFLKRPGRRQSAAVAAWAVAVSIVSIHAIGAMAILAITGFGLRIWQRRTNKPQLGKLLKFGLLSLAIFVAASSYWLAPLALGKGSTADTIASFSGGDQQAFATLGGSALGKLLHVARLQGFWAEDRALYALPQTHVPTWNLLALMIWALVIAGAIRGWRAGGRFEVRLLATSMLVAAIVAIGPLNGWLAGHLPLFAGYREPQKFVAIIALSYALFGAWGVAALLDYSKRQMNTAVGFAATAGLVLLLPLAFCVTMLWGCNGQLTARSYPADWYTVNRRLDSDRGNFQTLFLPWHLYMYFDFAGRIIASPAPGFFDKPIIVSDNPEFKDAAAAGSTAAKRRLDRILPRAAHGRRLGAELAPLNVKYVLLARDGDYQKYAYLDRQNDLKIVARSATMDLYRNEAYRGK
jgi:hypothetical protein